MVLQLAFRCLLCIALFSTQTTAKFVFDLQDDFQTCKPGVPIPAINVSELEFSQMDGKSMQISGKISFDKDYGGLVGLNLYSRRLERGTWSSGEISRSEMDVCSKLQIPTEPWFIITKHFRKKGCPFKAGHLEVLPAIPVGDLGMDIPPQFAGEWKFFLEFSVSRNGRFEKECFVIPATVVEV